LPIPRHKTQADNIPGMSINHMSQSLLAAMVNILKPEPNGVPSLLQRTIEIE